MLAMKKLIILAFIFITFLGCKRYSPGVEYYFKSGVTYQGYRPTGEISKSEAEQLAQKGYAYYIAYFNEEGKPIKIFKVYNGTTSLYWQYEFDKNDVENILKKIEKNKE